MNLLILGGTVFVGRHLVEAALARGHQVTLFNRGQHSPELFPEVEKLRGDRDKEEDLAILKGRTWDAVIDTCGYVPRVVRQSARLLADSAAYYAFISSISVYADFRTPRIGESYPTGKIADETVETVTNETYGPLKALCEAEAEAAFPDRTLVVRPGMIVGPHDPTDRFTWWPVRVARGGEMLVPGAPDNRFEVIDARDLADWTLKQIEAGTAGVFNVTGPDYELTAQAVLETCRQASGSEARFTYVDPTFLTAHEVNPGSLHCWLIPDDEPDFRCIFDIDCGRALATGLTYRPLAETVRDILAWHATLPACHTLRVGLEPDRERELLAQWHERQNAA